MKDYQTQAKEFLKKAHQFHLGVLPTEQPHPQTMELSDLAEKDLTQAIEVLRQVDLQALDLVLPQSPRLFALHQRIQKLWQEGGRLYLCGCGATGRLSLALEALWRERYPESDQVISFMAGGDIALVHSLEGFEDHPEYGARHLRQLGFRNGDLLISCTEGGETPYVIGATEEALKISDISPYFLYCNPDEILIQNVERSRSVIKNDQIEKINLTVGRMALSGSTRMQASTVLMLAVGLALLGDFSNEIELQGQMMALIEGYKKLDLSGLESFISQETETYLSHNALLYSVDTLGLTVFTDTTERAPTFNLTPFEPFLEREFHSLCYTYYPDCTTQEQSWKKLLGRPPRALEWLEVNEKTSLSYLMGYDFSQNVELRRQEKLKIPHYTFRIQRSLSGFVWSLDPFKKEFSFELRESLFEHLILKMVLNIHSTLVMGRLGRYKNNIMTWVTPSNGKLIDRAARYVKILLAQEVGDEFSYEQIVEEIFKNLAHRDPSESVVLKVCKSLKARNRVANKA